jgi:hypothetical protein
MTTVRHMEALFLAPHRLDQGAPVASHARHAWAASSVCALMLALVAGCDTPAPPAPAPSAASTASEAPLYVPPPPEGCARSGPLVGVESDPTCVVTSPDERAMRDAMKHLTFALAADTTTVIAGGTVMVRLTITNTTKVEVALVLDAEPPSASPRPDWTRLAGVPEPKPVGSGTPPPEPYRLRMPVRTLDAHERSVDGLPTTPSVSTAALRSLHVRVRPGGKLTHTFTWWALRIPTPGPITRDDAGHRFVPKTAPVPLAPGEYVVALELPLHGIEAPESVVTTLVRVESPDVKRDR